MNLTHVLTTSAIVLCCSTALTAQTPPPEQALGQTSNTNMMPQQPATITGRIAIQALQGTPGGPVVAGNAVTVQFVHQGQIVFQRETLLDEHGVVLIEDIPLSVPLQPMVLVAHAGVTYQKVGSVMDATAHEQKIEVICYELTEETPDWTINMRHVMLGQTEHGLTVTEVFVIDNPSPETWLGIKDGDRRITTQFSLPQGAEHVTLGKGFHDWCCSTVEEGRLVNHLPLMPNRTEMSFSYHVTPRRGQAALVLAAPTFVEHLMVMVPADIALASYDGLEPAGEQDHQGTVFRYFMASNVQAGQAPSLELTGLTGGKDLAMLASTSTPATNTTTPKLIAGIGGGLILLLGVVILMMKSPKKAAIES